MKNILRLYLIDTLALYAVSQIAGGIVLDSGFETLLLAVVGLTVASVLVRPVINLLLLPLNLITFGLFRWVSSAIALYLVTLVVPGFTIVAFNFVGFSSKWIVIPPINLSGILAFVAFSFLLSVITSIVHWIIK